MVGLAIGFVMGIGNASQSVAINSKAGLRPSSQKLYDVLSYLQYRYVDSVNIDSLMNKAINEVFDGLDPHSEYIEPINSQEISESLDGNFEGIGVEFNILNDTIRVVSPIEGGPSERLGILAGDKIIQIEDSVVAGIGIENRDVLSLLKGPKGSKVKVSIKRSNSDELIDFSITRDRVYINSVVSHYLMNEDFGYMRISKFSANTYEEFKSALSELVSQGMSKLVLDLRGNGGGYMEDAIRIADEFLSDDKLIVYTEGVASPKRTHSARYKGLFESGDLYLLVNEGSASASEILAGALQDWDRATIIGRRTFGKGLVQEQIPLEDGSMMRLTTARYYTPNGRMIQRPYERGRDEYYEEYAERFSADTATGHADMVLDSVEWGIKPDIRIPFVMDEQYEIVAILASIGVIQSEAYQYFAHNSSELTGQYSAPEELLNDFQIPSEIEDKVWNVIKEFSDYKPSWKSTYQKEVNLMFTSYLARQMFYQEGYYRIFNQLDPELRKAMESIQTE